MRIALAGNPNSGKTTLFNAITGKIEHVGNWAGVTVEKKEGKVKQALNPKKEDLTVVDLPRRILYVAIHIRGIDNKGLCGK